MNENIFVSGGDLVINYSLKIGGVVAPLGSVPFSLRYYNPNDESNYVEASFDGTNYKNITPEGDHYVIGIKDVNFEVGRMFCWERIQVASTYFADGKRTDSSRYDVGEIVKETTNLDNINTQVNFLQGVWFNFPNRYVDVLPAVGVNGIFYFVPNGSNATNIYIYSDAEFHLVGSTSINLADFYTKAEINSLLSNYVLKVPGSGLITDLERDRLTHAVDTTDLDVALLDYVRGAEGQRLMTSEEAIKLGNAVTAASLETQLAWYVSKVPGERLLKDTEATKIANSVVASDVDDKLAEYSETEALQTVLAVNKDSIYDFKLWDPEKKLMLKLPVVNLLNSMSNVVLTKQVKSLIGDKNGGNDTFTCDKYILGSSRVYVNKIPQFLGRHFEELNNTSIRFFEYLPEGQDELLIEAIFE